MLNVSHQSIFGFWFFGQSDQKTKKSAVIFMQNEDFFYTENKQTGELICGHFDEKTKTE